MKQRKAPAIDAARARTEAEDLLVWLSDVVQSIKALEEEAAAAMEAVTARYNAMFTPLRDELAARDKEIISLMKTNKAAFFSGTDVVNLPPGSLIRNMADHVSIPKTALAACKENDFLDVIKTVESLDRDAIEKWPDAKLAVIGATRKPKEEFKYNLKF